MSRREATHNFLAEYGLPFALIGTLIVLGLYASQISYTDEANLIIGDFIQIVLNGITMCASLVAFLAAVVSPKDKWRDMMEFRTYIGIGCLVGFIASGVTLIQAFQAVTTV